MDIGIFIIATNRFIDFFPSLYEGLNKFFLVNHKKTIYLFTDSDKVPDGVNRVYQEHKPWPYPTLYRYHIISDFADANKINHDYYYYLDVDMLVVDFVGDEVLGELVATCHPGFYHKQKLQFASNDIFLSRSYIPFKLIKRYYAGGFNGGSRYLEMAKQIREWIDIDQKWGFVPDWNDESYLNKYLAYHPPTVELDPAYCLPNPAQGPEDIKEYRLTNVIPKILCLYKAPEYLIGRPC